ncbi:hypothetical protein V2J09_013657 [Rumex salicifolius]
MKNLRVLELPVLCGSCSRLGLSSERHKNLHTFKCGAGKWMKKDLLVLSPTVRDLHLYNITEMEEVEGIYKCLSLLKDSLHTFSCRFFAAVGQLLPPNLVSLCLRDSGIREGVNLMEVQTFQTQGQAMDRLKVITIIDCRNLKRLPERLRSITTLKELKIKVMPLEFCKRWAIKEMKMGFWRLVLFSKFK